MSKEERGSKQKAWGGVLMVGMVADRSILSRIPTQHHSKDDIPHWEALIANHF